MRQFLRFLLGVSVFGAFAGWVLSAVPGRIESFLLASMILAFLGIGALFVIGIPLGILYLVVNYYEIRDWYRDQKNSAGRLSFDKSIVAEALAIPLVWFVFLFVYAAGIPEMIGFSACRSQFESAAAEFAATQTSLPQDGRFVFRIEKKIGIYHVDEVRIDGRGGIYFRVNTGQDGIGPDQMSYGFVKNPNRTGSPFGRSHYSVRQIAEEWYTFQASDDFF